MEGTKRIIKEIEIAGFHVICQEIEQSEEEREKQNVHKVKRLLEILRVQPNRDETS